MTLNNKQQGCAIDPQQQQQQQASSLTFIEISF